jgi:hypothetical protein
MVTAQVIGHVTAGLVEHNRGKRRDLTQLALEPDTFLD